MPLDDDDDDDAEEARGYLIYPSSLEIVVREVERKGVVACRHI